MKRPSTFARIQEPILSLPEGEQRTDRIRELITAETFTDGYEKVVDDDVRLNNLLFQRPVFVLVSPEAKQQDAVRNWACVSLNEYLADKNTTDTDFDRSKYSDDCRMIGFFTSDAQALRGLRLVAPSDSSDIVLGEFGDSEDILEYVLRVGIYALDLGMFLAATKDKPEFELILLNLGSERPLVVDLASLREDYDDWLKNPA